MELNKYKLIAVRKKTVELKTVKLKIESRLKGTSVEPYFKMQHEKPNVWKLFVRYNKRK